MPVPFVSPMVLCPAGYPGATAVPLQSLVDLAPQVVVRLADHDVKGANRLLARIGVPDCFRVPAAFQLAVGYGIAHGPPLDPEDLDLTLTRLSELPSEEPAAGLQLGLECIPFLTAPGPKTAGVSPYHRALALEDGAFAMGRSDPSKARELYERALEGARGIPDERQRAHALGVIAYSLDSVEDGLSLRIAEEALEGARKIAHPAHRAVVLAAVINEYGDDDADRGVQWDGVTVRLIEEARASAREIADLAARERALNLIEGLSAG